MSAAPSPEQRLAVAFSLARHGFHVFPVSTRKRPMIEAWQSAATRDPELIATWWTLDYPGALVGYAAGPSGVVVVDLDTDKPYPENHETRAGESKGAGLDNLVEAGHDLTPTGMVYATPSGGQHYVYAAPEGRALTIAQDTPAPGVDIRAGNGFAIYYGRKLKAAPDLAPAPDWALVDAREKSASRSESATLAAWLERVESGKASKAVKSAAALIAERGTDHGAMLSAVGDLVRLGSTGEPGAGRALLKARERYTRHYPDYDRHFDAAVDGSVKHHGLPPATLKLSKSARADIARRASGGVMQPKSDDDVDRGEPITADDLTDAALAEQVADELRDRFAYARGLGLVRYDGRVWASVDEVALIEATRLIARRVRADETRAAIMRGDKRREAEARALEQRARIVAIARLAGGIMAEHEQTADAHPDLLNTPTGVVHLPTGELRPHDPALMFTKITAVGYDPDADRTSWLRALESLPPRVADWLQVRLGQGATGYRPEDDRLLIFEGSGENGKTTVLFAPRVALGAYAVTVPDRLLMANPGDHPTELTVLMGARFAVVEELAEGRSLNVKRLKDTVGTPEITARKIGKDNVTWRTTHGLYLSTNYLPVVAETDHGTWRRLSLVRFPYRFVDAAALAVSRSKADRLGDPAVRRHFEDAPDAGVLAWLVDGARAWYEAGRTMPPTPKRVKRDTLSWRHDADPVLSYVAERLLVGEAAEGFAISATDLSTDFNEYLEAKQHRPWSASTITARFGGHEALRDVTRKVVRFGPKWLPSRPAGAYRPLPQGASAWLGVRFADEPGPTVPPSREVASFGLDGLD